jgi:mono/diheme cytochrome c family protein
VISLNSPSQIRWGRVPACLALALAAGLAGCRGDTSDSPPRQFFPDMDDQPKLKPQSRSDFFKEYDEPGEHGGAGGHADAHGGEHAKDTSKMFGRGMRDPVANTIAFGRTAEVEADGTANFMGKDFGGRADLLREDESVYIGYTPVLDAAGKQVMNADGSPKRTYIDYIPIPVTKELIAEGRAQYNILCITCHGGTGLGDGLVGQRWAYALPNYNDPKYFHGGEKGQDGYLFSVIREGVPNIGGPATMPYKMRPYNTKLTEHESWAVIAYIRTLQAHRKGTMNDVPADQREKLMQTNSNPMPSGAASNGGAQ